MTRTGRRIALALLFLLLAGGGAYYYWTTTEQSHGAQQQQQQAKQQQKGRGGFRRNAANGPNAEPVPVLAIDARRADVPVYLDGVGTAKALNTVTVRPQVDGKLIQVSFTEGQDVPKGYVLAKIDPTTYQAQYDQAVAKKSLDDAQLANARLDLERYSRLASTNAINKQQLDTQKALVAQLEAQIRLDQAAIDNARAVLSYTDVVAPIAGRTGIRQVDVGNIVHATDTSGLVVITQVRPISIMFNLPQQNLPALNKGMSEGPLPIEAISSSNAVLDKGKVLVIDNQVDPATGTVKLKAEFPNDNLQLWPGQFVNVRVLIDTLRQVVVVPTAAVQRGPNGTFVFVIKDDSTVTVRQVSVKQQDDLQAVIASGLEPNERVVTTGFARLAEGTKVTATSAEEAGQVSNGSKRRREGPRAEGGRGRGASEQASGGTASATP